MGQCSVWILGNHRTDKQICRKAETTDFVFCLFHFLCTCEGFSLDFSTSRTKLYLWCGSILFFFTE